MDLRIRGARQRLDSLLERAKSKPISTDDELKAEIARLLCVLCSGLIEESVRILLRAYIARRSSPQVSAFASSRLSSFQNPKFEKILQLLSSFDPVWRAHFDKSESLQMKDAINSIVANRNSIAHGQTAGISVASFESYYGQVCKFIDDLDRLLN